MQGTLDSFLVVKKPPDCQPPIPEFSSMHESPRPNSAKISCARSKSSKKRTRKQKLSKTSPAGSTSKEKDCVPFWNNVTREWSTRLLSCTETDLLDSEPNYWSTFWNNTASASWFTLNAHRIKTDDSKAKKVLCNSQKTCLPSPPSLWRLITANEQLKQENDAAKRASKRRKKERCKAVKIHSTHLRAYKVRFFFPTGQARQTLLQWFGVARRAYNIFVDVFNAVNRKQGVLYARYQALKNEFVLRDENGRPKMCVKDGRIAFETQTRGHKGALKQLCREVEREHAPDFVRKVPQTIRDNAIRDFEKAQESVAARKVEANAKGEKIGSSTFKHRSRRDRLQTIEINARD